MIRICRWLRQLVEVVGIQTCVKPIQTHFDVFFSDFVVRLWEPDGHKLKRAESHWSGNSHTETSRCNAHRKPSVHVRRVLSRRTHENWGYDFRDTSAFPMSRILINFSQREWLFLSLRRQIKFRPSAVVKIVDSNCSRFTWRKSLQIRLSAAIFELSIFLPITTLIINGMCRRTWVLQILFRKQECLAVRLRYPKPRAEILFGMALRPAEETTTKRSILLSKHCRIASTL